MLGEGRDHTLHRVQDATEVQQHALKRQRLLGSLERRKSWSYHSKSFSQVPAWGGVNFNVGGEYNQ